jgi:hypothetical protein
MAPNPVIRLVRPAPPTKDALFAGLIRRLGRRRLARALVKHAPTVGDDPYLLVLLADQELVYGRKEQARYLVEAAYEFFDHKTRASVHRLYLAG